MEQGKTLGEVAAEKASATVEVCGIEAHVADPRIFNDFEVFEMVMVINDPDASEVDKAYAFTKYGPLVFGSKQWKSIKDELRKQNGGKLPNEKVYEFILKSMMELGAKN